MEDKIYDLPEKVYIELQESKKDLKNDIEKIDARLTKIELKIEHDVTNKIGSLYEAQTQTNEQLKSITDKLEDMSQKI
jgi:hypothetical protein